MLEQEINALDTIPFPLLQIMSDGSIAAYNQAFSHQFNVKPSVTSSLATFFQIPDHHIDLQAILNSQQETCIFAIFKKSLVEKHNVQLRIKVDEQASNMLIVLVEKSPYWHQKYQDKQQKLQRIEQCIAKTSTGLWEYDLVNQQAVFSPKFKHLIGLSEQLPLTWQAFRQMVFNEDKGIFDAFFNNHVRFDIMLSFEFRMVINEQIKWFQLKGEAVQEDHKKSCVMGSLTDCTEIKNTIAKLNEAVDSKKIAMKAGHIGTWRADRNEDDTWHWSWDELASEMFLFSENETNIETGGLDKWSELLHPEDAQRVLQAIDKALNAGKFFNEHYRVILPSGELKYILGKGTVSKNFQGKIYRIDGICIDQTIIYKVQQELELLNNQLEQRVLSRTKLLEQAKVQAEQANQTKTDFLSMMSHELRTPMNAVIGSLDLLSTTEQTVESLDLIDTAKTSANNLVFILNDILDINKIEAGKLELEESAFSVSEVIDNVVKVFIPVLAKQDITLEVVEDPQIPRFVKGDATRVRQILFNILGNAIKFTTTSAHKKGKIQFIATVEESNTILSNVKFTISDNGIGIAKDVQKNLFKPFTQAERSTTRKYGGTGLGLNICGKLTEMMGGQITLRSQLGEGTSFFINLPLWISQETTALEVEILTGTNVAILSTDEAEQDRIYRWTAYLAEEGAIVKIIDLDNAIEHCHEYDVVVVLTSLNEQAKQRTNHLYTKVKDSSNICCAINRNEIAEFRKFLPGIKHIPTLPITRVQFIEAVKQIKETSHTLTLDDLDMDELELSLFEEQKEQPSLKGGILVVEDNPLNQKLIKKQMKNIGYECDIANNGEEGIQQWQQCPYKLILTDCHMPLIDGYDMTRNIRALEVEQKREPIPIIAITGAAMTGDEKHCFEVGMNDFVSKPMQIADLKAVLKKWYQ